MTSSFVVDVFGSRDSRQLPLLQTAFRKHGARVRYHVTGSEESSPPAASGKIDPLQSDPPSDPPASPPGGPPGTWSVLLCLNTSMGDDACVVKAAHGSTPYSKVNVIPVLQRVLSQPHRLCVHSGPHSPGRWLGGELPCRTSEENSWRQISLASQPRSPTTVEAVAEREEVKVKEGGTTARVGGDEDEVGVARYDGDAAREEEDSTRDRIGGTKNSKLGTKDKVGGTKDRMGGANDRNGGNEDRMGGANGRNGGNKNRMGAAKARNVGNKGGWQETKFTVVGAEDNVYVSKNSKGLAQNRAGGTKEVVGVAKEGEGVAQEGEGVAQEGEGVAKNGVGGTKDSSRGADGGVGGAKEEDGTTDGASDTRDIHAVGGVEDRQRGDTVGGGGAGEGGSWSWCEGRDVLLVTQDFQATHTLLPCPAVPDWQSQPGRVVVIALESPSTVRGSPKQDTDRQETERQINDRQDTDRQGTDRHINDRQDTDRQETERQEIDRQGTERKDKDSQDIERRGTERKVTDRKGIEENLTDDQGADNQERETHVQGLGGPCACLYVVVGSLSPLRLNLLPSARLLPSLAALLAGKAGRLLELGDLGKELDSQGCDVTEALEEAVVAAMLEVERASLDLQPRVTCAGCFQVLEMTVVFRTPCQPLVLRVSPWRQAGSRASLVHFLFQQRLLEAVASLVAPGVVSPVAQVARSLVQLGFVNGRNNSLCDEGGNHCLGSDDFRFMLENWVEDSRHLDLHKIYPTLRSTRFDGLIRSTGVNLRSAGSEVNTWSRHRLLVALERMQTSSGQADPSDVSVPLNPVDDQKMALQFGSEGSKTGMESGNETNRGCEYDPAWLPYLSWVRTTPPLVLQPEFSPLVAHYTAEVTYHTLHVKVEARARHCLASARLEDKHSQLSSSSFPLGLGENVIRVLVVDPGHVEPWILNVYSIRVLRSPRDVSLGPLTPTTPHTVCRLSQDCGLRYSQDSQCGLQPIPGLTSWQQVLVHLSSLPPCLHADLAAHWLVPCADCKDASSCHWQQATWQPSRCHHSRLPRSRLRLCLQDKAVLFLGDSTVRGTMHYLAEAVNGSLWQWDKSHGLRHFRGLGGRGTVLGFRYFPQFWLSPSQRLPLTQALLQLLHSSGPLHNSTRTVLVIGGVHWLSSSHLLLVSLLLHREGLSGARVIVKGLGAGFHQPAAGIHTLDTGDHRRLLQHNQAVLTHARELGFRPVDTFNMTMARYGDFLQGKCACHFHRVVQEGTGRHRQGAPRYRVEGDVNAVLSELVINQICDRDRLVNK